MTPPSKIPKESKMTKLERLERLEANIEKFTKTIERHRKSLAKKEALLAKAANEDDRFWIECDIEHLNESIDSNKKKIAEAEVKMDALRCEIERKADFEASLPEGIKTFRDSIVSAWDEYDIRHRNAILAKGPDYFKNFKGKEARYWYAEWLRASELTDEKIHNENLRAANALVVNFLHRVEAKGGRPKNFDYLRVASGNSMEGAAINGIVECERRNVNVQSIHAGGWNIQRLHVRVLVK